MSESLFKKVENLAGKSDTKGKLAFFVGLSAMVAACTGAGVTSSPQTAEEAFHKQYTETGNCLQSSPYNPINGATVTTKDGGETLVVTPEPFTGFASRIATEHDAISFDVEQRNIKFPVLGFDLATQEEYIGAPQGDSQLWLDYYACNPDGTRK